MTFSNNSNWRRILRNGIGLTFVIVIFSACSPAADAQNPCADFARVVKATYNFRPALLSESERTQKSAAMDVVWNKVKGDRDRLLPCLRKELEDSNADAWFRFDGSNLLVSLDPSPTSKSLLIQNYAEANLDDVDLSLFVSRLAQLGAEGFDTSDAGERWLSSSNPTYFLPQHGALPVDKFLGGIFIFGSMDETHATPALLKTAGTKTHAGREVALSLLLMQATPEAVRGLKSIDLAGLSPELKATLSKHITHPKTIEKRKVSKTSREQFLNAFNAFIKGDREPFASLVSAVPDGERDVVTVLKAEDVPLVRKVRRLMIANANQHAAEYYVTFTQILATMISELGTAK